MMVMDCISNEVMFEGLDEQTAAAKCDDLGGNARGYYVFPDIISEVKKIESFDIDKNIGGLFG